MQPALFAATAALFFGIAQAGETDVEPAAIVHSCAEAWCAPVTAAYRECLAAGRAECETDRKVKAAHHQALGRTPPDDLSEEYAARRERESAERVATEKREAADRERRLAGKPRFMGYALSMTQADVANLGGMDCKAAAAACFGRGFPEAMFKFDGDRLYSISLHTDSDDKFIELAAMLKQRFGKPSSMESKPVTNRMGAKFEKVTMKWKVGSAEIFATNITSRIDAGIIVFHDPAITRKILTDERRQQRNIF